MKDEKCEMCHFEHSEKSRKVPWSSYGARFTMFEMM